MKQPAILFGALLFVALPLPAGEIRPILIKAQSGDNQADVQRIHDEDALGTEYVWNPREYNPVFACKVPEEGEEWIIWVRYRGEAIQLKAVQEDGSQTEFNWLWNPPLEWEWRSFGAHNREELGESLLIIRSKGGAENSGLDAVFLAPTRGIDPNTIIDFSEFE